MVVTKSENQVIAQEWVVRFDGKIKQSKTILKLKVNESDHNKRQNSD